MRGVNKVILIGTLGRDPELKNFPNGGCVCNFSIATSEGWVDKNTGEKKEATEWHRITANNRLGEIAAQYLRKGSKVYIEGSLRTRQWQDQNGNTQYTTEVRCENMQLIDSQSSNNQNNGGYNNQNNGGYNNQNNGGYNNQNNGGYNNQNNGGYNNQNNGGYNNRNNNGSAF